MQPPVRAEELFIEATLLSHPLESEEYSMFNVPWKKQYDIWRHGDELIANATSPRDFEVAIMQLQRAVEQRDTILEQSYQFKTCPWFGKGLSHYAIMAELGIIRPSLKDPLRQLRNRIAHEVNDVVLERKQCEHLSDTAWYYLKATDLITRQCAAKLTLHCGEDDPHYTLLTFEFTPRLWVVSITGNIPDRHLLSKRSPDALSVTAASARFENYRGVQHCKFRGSLTGPEALCQRILQTFFEEAV
jgi:hypothetical protein